MFLNYIWFGVCALYWYVIIICAIVSVGMLIEVHQDDNKKL